MLSSFLREHKNKEKASFHMPGHKGRRIFDEHGMKEIIDSLVDGDVTEIPGADNLFVHDGVIREIMDEYKSLYGSKETFLSVSGSSAGIVSSILATVKRGEEVIIPRNCHRSVFNGISLAGARPVIVYPETIEDFNIYGRLSPKVIAKKVTAQNTVIVTSPNYYGICSDIHAIAKTVHDRGGLLIVDQAHGAHLNLTTHGDGSFVSLAQGDGRAHGDGSFVSLAHGDGSFVSLAHGDGSFVSSDYADIVIESTHKTMASFTQTAIVNIYNEELVKPVEEKLRMIESTSPSYILMQSLELNARLTKEYGDELLSEWKSNLDYFYESAKSIPGLRVLDLSFKDRSKIVIDAKSIGLSAKVMDELLMERGVYSEFTSGNLIVFMSGIGNVRSDYELLLESIKDMQKNAESIMNGRKADDAADIVTDKYGAEAVRGEDEPIPAPGEILEI